MRSYHFVLEVTFKPKSKQALLVRQPQTYDNAVTFAKWKHHFTDNNSETELMEFLQEIGKEVSQKHTDIKEEPYSALVQDTHSTELHQNISQPETNMLFLKESIIVRQNQYTAVALQ